MVQSVSASAASTAGSAVGIVIAYVSNNHVPASELPALITHVHGLLAGLTSDDAMSRTDAVAQAAVEKPGPVEISQSVRRDGIVSFIDGRSYKTLKRHLTAHGLHPQSYRERYGLPTDYPMVAGEYAERRSALAKRIGLGQPGRLGAHRNRRVA